MLPIHAAIVCALHLPAASTCRRRALLQRAWYAEGLAEGRSSFRGRSLRSRAVALRSTSPAEGRELTLGFFC